MYLIQSLNIGNKLVTDFKEKAKLFNDEFLALKYIPITNHISYPSLLNLNLTSNWSVINVTDHGILRINRSLNFNKAHGHDDIFIRIFKISNKTTLEPLRIVFTQKYSQIYGKNLILFQCTKKINILLPILGKNFEKKKMYIYKKTTCVEISVVFDHLIHVNISFSQ